MRRSTTIVLLVGLIPIPALAQGTPPVPAHIGVHSVTAKRVYVRDLLYVDGGTVFVGPVTSASMAVNSLRAGVVDAGSTYTDYLQANTARLNSATLGVVDAGVVYTPLLLGGQIDAGFVRTNLLHAGTVDAGAVYSGLTRADVATVGTLDAGAMYGTSLRVGQIDAGFVRVDVLQGGTLDAGVAWLAQASNPDGGHLYVPLGLDLDQGSKLGFRGPNGDAFISHTGGTLALSAGAGLKVATVDGFFTQSEGTFGELSANALQCSGGPTATTVAVVNGTGGPTADAGIDIFPVGHGTVRIWGDGLRTPQVGNPDGGFIWRTGLGVSPTPAPFVPLCDGVTVPFGSLIYYNFQWWECSAALASLGAPGTWSYPGQPPLTFTARTPGDPQGAATAAGIPFNSQNPGTHYTQLGDFVVRVEFAGTCGGGCTAGTNAYYLIVQKNPQDGGYRELARQQIPCTAPQGFCAMTAAPGSTGCVSDGGLFAQALPVSMGGLVALEIRADGGQCSTPPAVSVSGFGFLLMQADGGGA